MSATAPRSRDVQQARLPAQQLRDNFCDLHPPLQPIEAAAEAARCLFCFDAPCTEACPTGIDIPGFIRKISSGNLRGAAVTILSENIMGSSCASVCPVENLCEAACVRNTAEHRPVPIGRLQRHATDHLLGLGTHPFRRSPASGRRVAVVGAGPAGLSCAHRLATLGHEVTVFEARDKPGGLNEFGIAAYKMANGRAAREVAFILQVGGITLRTGSALGRDFDLGRLRREYDAVFLGLGHNAVNRLGLDNEDAPGVENAVDFIARIRQHDLATLPVGRRVVVIGGGNTAIDISVQMRRLGAELVTLVYRRGPEHMGATWHEREIAQTSGVTILNWASPCRIGLAAGEVASVTFERTRLDEADKVNGTGEHFELPADQLFKAIGQHFADDAPGLDAGLLLPDGRIAVDAERRTRLAGVWAGGDCVPGPDLTVVAVQDGKIAAQSMHRFLQAGAGVGSNG